MFFQNEFIYSINSRKLYFIGNVYAEIELINGDDLCQARRGEIDPDEVRKIRIIALVDMDVANMVINENIQETLQLPVKDHRKVQLKNGNITSCDLIGPLDIRFENRHTICQAYVLPGNSEPILGLIPFGGMDVVIDPAQQKLVVNPKHPDGAIFRTGKLVIVQ